MSDLPPLQEEGFENRPERRPRLDPIRLLTLVLLVLAAAQGYTFLQLGDMKASLDQHLASQSDASGAIPQEIEDHLSLLDRAYLELTRKARKQAPTDLDNMLSDVAVTKARLNRNVSAVHALHTGQERSKQELRTELGEKADLQQVGMLSGSLSTTQRDLASTNKRLQQAVAQLGMERSELGTLIAHNHDEIENLQGLGKRDYFEFTLHRTARPQPVGGVGLRLRKTNPKRLRYTVEIYADDYRMEEKGRGINEPIFFYVRSSKQPVELVVNNVQQHDISGYVSALKGTMQGSPLKPLPDWEPFQELKRQPAGHESRVAGGLPPSSAVGPN